MLLGRCISKLAFPSAGFVKLVAELVGWLVFPITVPLCCGVGVGVGLGCGVGVGVGLGADVAVGVGRTTTAVVVGVAAGLGGC